jgi:COP9 signalosome complex subunit 5
MISTLAITKIVTHAVKAGDKEIAGYMIGFAKERIFYVVDAVEFPLIGSTSRIEIADQMGDKIHEYAAVLLDSLKKVGNTQNYVGWYHSHPGFGCWLSGIDVNTHKTLQMINKTFFALVVDPFRTISNRKIEVGCFMTYLQDSGTNRSNFSENIPLNKAQEFGYHANKYYKLEHQFFESKFESQIIKLLYRTYWTDTLSSNVVELNNEYTKSLIDDMANKIGGYELKKKSNNQLNQEQLEIHQRKLDEIVGINTNSSVNVQNELIKALIFDNDD